MQITDILAQVGGLQAMTRELGVSEKKAASGGLRGLLGRPLGGQAAGGGNALDDIVNMAGKAMR